SAYQVSPRASRAFRTRAGIPGGEPCRVVPALGGKSCIAVSRIRACRARSAFVSRRFMCCSLPLMVLLLSWFLELVRSDGDQGVVIRLFVDDDNIATVRNMAEDAAALARATDARGFVVLEHIIHFVRREIVFLHMLHVPAWRRVADDVSPLH